MTRNWVIENASSQLIENEDAPQQKACTNENLQLLAFKTTK